MTNSTTTTTKCKQQNYLQVFCPMLNCRKDCLSRLMVCLQFKINERTNERLNGQPNPTQSKQTKRANMQTNTISNKEEEEEKGSHENLHHFRQRQLRLSNPLKRFVAVNTFHIKTTATTTKATILKRFFCFFFFFFVLDSLIGAMMATTYQHWHTHTHTHTQCFWCCGL